MPPSARAPAGICPASISQSSMTPSPILKGELLPTTGIPVSGSEDRVRQYVRRLTEQKVAALGLGLRAGIDEVTPALTAACHAAEMQLLSTGKKSTAISDRSLVQQLRIDLHGCQVHELR
jgi:hypothetical protein